MKQTNDVIFLADYMTDGIRWGQRKGLEIFEKLRVIASQAGEGDIFIISLKGIDITDSSLARASVCALAKQLVKERGFAIRDIENTDVHENWMNAANASKFPLTCWEGEKFKILGPEPPEGTKEVLDEILKKGSLAVSDVAKKFSYSTSNASNKLRTLFERGYILRRARAAESGGIEHEYYRIR